MWVGGCAACICSGEHTASICTRARCKEYTTDAHKHAGRHTDTHKRMHTHAHTHARTLTQAHAYTRTHAHTHTHTPHHHTHVRAQDEDIARERLARESFTDFLRGVLDMDPRTRWTPRQAAGHPFVRGAPYRGPYHPQPGAFVARACVCAC